MKKIYGLYIIDKQREEIEKFLSVKEGVDINAIKEQVKSQIFLTKDRLEDGRTMVCINFANGVHGQYIYRDSNVDVDNPDEVDKCIKRNSNIVKYYDYTVSKTSPLRVNIAAAYLPDTFTEEQIATHLAHYRKDHYDYLIVQKYNDAIDRISQIKVVESINVDDKNKADF